MILAGDIGGTNARLAVVTVDGGKLRILASERIPARDHDGLESIVREFLARSAYPVTSAAFGVAGPVRNGRCETTNLPWPVIDAADLSHALSIPNVILLNDLEAAAHGLAELPPEDFRPLCEGAPNASGNRALISAGTGLGEAGLFFDGTRHHPFATEGSHATFSPRDDDERDLQKYLEARNEGHVSWERVVSGPGLLAIFEFLRDSGREKIQPAFSDRLRTESDPPAFIADSAIADGDTSCARALRFFVSLYGAEAGNFALKTMATGGVFLGGGIAPKILTALKDGPFLESFRGKGRMRKLLEAMPVYVVKNEKAALLGAARVASNLTTIKSPN